MNTFTRFRRAAAAVTMTAALAGGTIALGGGAAHAAPAPRAGCDRVQIADVNGVRGYAEWNQNPSSCYSKGDSFRVCDTASDGMGVYAEMVGLGASATTRGHTAGYCSPWTGHNLPEGSDFRMYVYTVKNGKLTWVNSYTLYA